MTGTNKIIEEVKRSLQPITRTFSIKNGKRHSLSVTRKGVGLIDTPYGKFWQYDFSVNDEWSKYTVLVKGGIDDDFNPVFSSNDIMIRIDSGCETGQIFLDRTCECREQLHKAMEKIGKHGEGMIINIPRQDGRGHGLPFKLGTLVLQHKLKMNTVQAAKTLAGNKEIDIRTYEGAVAILQFLHVDTEYILDLLSNNPRKHKAFVKNGYTTNLTAIRIKPNGHTRKHLKAKEKHLGHLHLT